MLDQFVGPLSCKLFTWTADEQKEPYYFKDNSNITDLAATPMWLRYSPDFYADVSDPRIALFRGSKDCSLSGVLVMLRPDTQITVTGGTGPGSPVTFTLPTGSIIFANTEGRYCNNASPFKYATAAKTFAETGTSNQTTIPQGTDSNKGHGDYRLFSHKLFGTGDSVAPTPTTANFNLYILQDGVPLALLRANGFITSNDILRCKFAHIITGSSHCYIRNLTCGGPYGADGTSGPCAPVNFPYFPALPNYTPPVILPPDPATFPQISSSSSSSSSSSRSSSSSSSSSSSGTNIPSSSSSSSSRSSSSSSSSTCTTFSVAGMQNTFNIALPAHFNWAVDVGPCVNGSLVQGNLTKQGPAEYGYSNYEWTIHTCLSGRTADIRLFYFTNQATFGSLLVPGYWYVYIQTQVEWALYRGPGGLCTNGTQPAVGHYDLIAHWANTGCPFYVTIAASGPIIVGP